MSLFSRLGKVVQANAMQLIEAAEKKLMEINSEEEKPEPEIPPITSFDTTSPLNLTQTPHIAPLKKDKPRASDELLRRAREEELRLEQEVKELERQGHVFTPAVKVMGEIRNELPDGTATPTEAIITREELPKRQMGLHTSSL